MSFQEILFVGTCCICSIIRREYLEKRKNKGKDKAVLTNTEERLPDFHDIKYNLSISINKYHYKNLFVDLIWLTNITSEDKDQEINRYIDRLIDRWWNSFREKIQKQLEEDEEEYNIRYKDIYDYVLYRGYYGKLIDYTYPIWTCLNLNYDNHERINDWFIWNWFFKYLKENNIYFNLDDLLNQNYIWIRFLCPFIEDLLKHKLYESWRRWVFCLWMTMQTFFDENKVEKAIDDWKTNDKIAYKIYKEFCDNFDRKLLMYIVFNATSFNIVYDKYPHLPNILLRRIEDANIEKKLLTFDINAFIIWIKKIIQDIPESINENIIQHYENVISEYIERAILTLSSDLEVYWISKKCEVILSSYDYDNSDNWSWFMHIYNIDKITISIYSKLLTYSFVIDIKSFKTIKVVFN